MKTQLNQQQLKTLSWANGNNFIAWPDCEEWKDKPRMTMKEIYKNLANIVYCKNCGIKIVSIPSIIRVFCSRKCALENRWGRKRKILYICKKCDKEFKDHLCRKRQYCSKHCWYKRNEKRQV